MKLYKTLKVFDSTDMPRELGSRLAESWDLSNNSFIKWNVGESEEIEDMADLDKWLLENGASDEEDVIILVWW